MKDPKSKQVKEEELARTVCLLQSISQELDRIKLGIKALDTATDEVKLEKVFEYLNKSNQILERGNYEVKKT